MFIQLLSLAARAAKGLFAGVLTFLERDAQSKQAIIAHYSGRRWCDTTERALNHELMGSGSWLANRFASNDG